ncbi:MAG: 3'-5' exonuclease [Candidatus Omnitrophota bacterium]|nr:3'-5' exonuclease [Candidatus Omnitrophota bacterium]
MDEVKLNLSRPFVVLDLETTGVWLEKDKIIEIGLIKCQPDGPTESYARRVNPGIPIPAVVVELTGITDDDVKSQPYFGQIATEVLDFIGDSDLGGFNVERFDLPLLAREMAEAGYTFAWKGRSIYDAQQVYHYHEKRDLKAAYKFFCNKELEGAHSAMNDSEATLRVLAAQVQKYGGESGNLESLQGFSYQRREHFYDKTGKFRWWNGEVHPSFGKYAKYSLKELSHKHRSYLSWILKSDFSDEVKDLVENALNGNFPTQITEQ